MGIDIHKLGPEAQRQVLRKLQEEQGKRRQGGTDNPSVAARVSPSVSCADSSKGATLAGAQRSGSRGERRNRGTPKVRPVDEPETVTARSDDIGSRGAGYREGRPYDRGGIGGAGKGGKYRNEKTSRVMPNGEIRWFDSKAEARRYDDLYAAWKVGAIRELRLQQTFTLQESYIAADGTRVRAIKYVADFTYISFDGEYVVEDVKSRPTMTRVFQMNRKLMAERFGIQIKVVCEE